MPKENKLVVRDSVTLAKWRQLLRFTLPPADLPIAQIRLPQLSSLENDRLSERAARLQSLCACALSGMLMSVTLIGILLMYVVKGGRLADVTLAHMMTLAGGVVLGALTGKLLDLLWARAQLLALARRLYHQLARE